MINTPRALRMAGVVIIAVSGAAAIIAAWTWWQTGLALLAEIAAFTSWLRLTRAPALEQ